MPAEVGRRERHELIRRTSLEAVERATLLCLRLLAVRDSGEAVIGAAAVVQREARVSRARLRAERGRGWDDPPSTLSWFVLHGLLDGRPAWALWSAGVLECDRRLEARAWILVDLDETFEVGDPPRMVGATLDGPPTAIAITLIRACDVVVAMDMSLPSVSGAGLR